MKAENMKATQESVWAAFRESDRQLQESRAAFDRRMEESRTEFDKQMQESRAAFDRRMEKNERFLTEKLAETDKQLKETDRYLKETDRYLKETDRYLKESAKQWRKSCVEYDRQMKTMNKTFGSWSEHIGYFAEEYFFNSFENGKRTFFGEKFDDIEKNAKGFKKGYKDEYDILLINGRSIGIVEVKFKAHKNDIPDIIKKAETFRVNFPDYAQHRVYLGLATMSFYSDLEEECINKGIAVIKQVGDTVVINDAHLKVY
jgi:hypothetical protein